MDGGFAAVASLARPLAKLVFCAPAMPTEVTPKTHCPTCGAKLYRHDLSLCAYCGSPLVLGGTVGPKDDETTRRLARLRENPAFAAALSFSPVDSEVKARSIRWHNIGWTSVAAGVVVFAIVLLSYGLDAWSTWQALAPLAVAAAGAVALVVASAMVSRDRMRPMLRRPAIVTSRRSETDPKGRKARTVYYFLLRFDDGSEGEFRWPGQGTTNEPSVVGTTGVAYTRGERLLDLRRM